MHPQQKIPAKTSTRVIPTCLGFLVLLFVCIAVRIPQLSK